MKRGFQRISKFICIGWVGLLCTKVAAQEEPISPGVRVIAQAAGDSIALRWAPNTSITWQTGNKQGYIVEKYLLLKDGKVLDKAIRQTFSLPTPIKPHPVESWEALVKNNKYGAIAAQAIYGSTFTVQDRTAPNALSVIQRVQEMDNRFAFALLAADFAWPVALHSGLAFTDKEVRNGEKYLYKVYIPNSKERIDTGYVYVGLSDFQPLPKPMELTAEAGDRSVLLSWNRLYYESLFVGYSIERSEDGGKTFRPTSDLPAVQPQHQESSQNSRMMFKLDSLPRNEYKYLFRVRGLTPFGQVGPASDAVEAVGLEAPDATPKIGLLKTLPGGKVYITWLYPWEKNHQLKGFAVERADKSSGSYRMVHKQLLSSTTRIFTDTLSAHSAYYRIRAVDQHGQITFTHPHLVQDKDSTPPTIPTQLTGVMDSTGIVTIGWKPSPEKDVLGYRVYRSNFTEDEYAQITVSPVSSSFFKDEVHVQSLTTTVYYKVVAVDKHFNESKFSEVLAVKRPDIIPPVPPVFQYIASTDSGVSLSWVNSSSTDVVAHVLYRTEDGINWQLITKLQGKNVDAAYIDTSIVSGKEYRYTLIALDENGLESSPAKPVVGRKILNTSGKIAQQISSKVNRKEKEIQLSWTFPDGNVKRFLIYRAVEDEPMRMFKAVEGGKTAFVDRELTINTKYRYRVRAVYPNGAQSGLSKEIDVQF